MKPILEGKSHIVQGSRMVGGGALRGGMPYSRYIPNRVLTFMENIVFGTRMAEFHSGYMLYSRTLLERAPFEQLQNNYNFDAEMIVLAHLLGMECAQIAIPTRYDDEVSSLDPVPYGINVLKMMARHLGGHYRKLLRKAGIAAIFETILRRKTVDAGARTIVDGKFFMKILLLGAGGFIGANLAERLVHDANHQITALDIEREKLDETVKGGEINYIHFDIRRNEKELERLTVEHDLVVDLVAMANPSLYVSNPVDVFKLNFSENLKIAEFCVKHKKRIVQFSTCEVYGITSARAFGKDSAKHPTPFVEDETPLIMGPVKNHRWIYACAKQLLERVLHAYGLEEGLNYSIIRPFNFIGPRIDYLPSEQTGNPRVFSHFMNALLYGTPMKLVDGGMNYRAYTYIDDAVDCIVAHH